MIKNWKVDGPEEFKVEKKIPGFETLEIILGLAELERIVGLVVECGIFSKSTLCVVTGATHGGYIPLKIAPYFKQIICNTCNVEVMLQNIEATGVQNVTFATGSEEPPGAIVIELYASDATGEVLVTISEALAPVEPGPVKKNSIKLQRIGDLGSRSKLIRNWNIVVAERLVPEFNRHFNRHISDIGELVWDNLIHFCVMVKNGGPLFQEMLTRNVNAGIIDRWTVLDTGSTDGTVAAVTQILGNSGKPGMLFEEPFINFRDSRNRCLDLIDSVGDRRPPCKYILMLDDTYVMQGNLRGFLETVRGDTLANSYSNLVRSNDVEYLSCRVTCAEQNLRYKYTLHEVIQEENNVNVRIPVTGAYGCWIEDKGNDSMTKRTVDRKQYDLQCLFDMLREEPENSRHLYYIAQTYAMLKDYRKAADFFRLRLEHHFTGFIEERNDALLELTRLEHQYLGVSWDICLAGYEQYSVLDPKRPDGHYFIGVHYYNNGDLPKAYDYFKKAFHIGFPRELRQYSLRPTISQHFVPWFLTNLAYGQGLGAPSLGVAAALHFLRESTIATDYEKSLVRDWLAIYQLVCAVKDSESKKIICFVAPGGFGQWDGNNAGAQGVGIGGSETWVIETARCLAAGAEVYVFCDCIGNSIIDGVHYRKIAHYLDFAGKTRITHCIISRFSEYVPAALASNGTENVHFIMHDIRPSGNIIPVDAKLRTVFCLSEWHKSLFLSQFPQFATITHALNYGVQPCESQSGQNSTAVPASFIYSSFANRGLSTILKIWPQIRKKYSNATLSVFCDLENQWALTNHGPEIALVKKMITDLADEGVHNYGWVSKPCLREHWARAMVWLYPCRFEETFCHTALEAAASKTLAITNGLAALDETAARERTLRISETVGIMECLEKGLDPSGNLSAVGKKLVDANYQWACEKTWKNQTKNFENLIKI